MLIDFDYLWNKYQIKSKQAVHLGAHWAEEAEAYHSHGIEQVIWVEALPEIYQELVRRIAPYPHDVALCACLSDEDGKDVVFHVANNQGQSSSFLEFGTHSKEHPTVKFTKDVQMKTKRFHSLYILGDDNDGNFPLLNGNSFLNIDLQGAELLALKGMGGLLRFFDYVYVEVNKAPLYVGCPMIEEIDAFLSGFKRVETKWNGTNGWGDAFYVREHLL